MRASSTSARFAALIIALFVGLILAVCGAVGRGVGGRRHCPGSVGTGDVRGR